MRPILQSPWIIITALFLVAVLVLQIATGYTAGVVVTTMAMIGSVYALTRVYG